ncbi:hypothetical protein BGZ60DRAFT_362596 [Tricladium varicosporioides]|nr:hypothetical protein BGZ60DRAFT_362596 [Hymenoscyphus varicosporioides]
MGGLPHRSNFAVKDALAVIWSLITIWRVLIIFLLLGNLKNIPLIWHLRIVNAFRFVLRTQRPKVPVGPEQLFQPLITTSHAPIMEIDFNLHKSNSSYFADIDIARTHLVCTLFSKGIEHMRGGTAAYTGAKKPLFGLALGAVSCSFKQELKPYETYELWSRVLSWDEKWIYIITHFVRKGVVLPRRYTLYPDQNGAEQESFKQRVSGSDADDIASSGAVVASALSKCVFKQGRRTVSPVLMLRESGLLPTKSLNDTLDNTIDHKTEQLALSSPASSDSERIERERQRGMKVAVTLAGRAQSALEDEFTADGEALGVHTDGTGLTGVVSTLAQLAHLKRDQVL